MPDLVRLAEEVQTKGAGRIRRRLERLGPGHVFTGGRKTLCTSQRRDTIFPVSYYRVGGRHRGKQKRPTRGGPRT